MMLYTKNVVMSLEISKTRFHIILCGNKQVSDGEIKFGVKEEGHHTLFHIQEDT